MQHEIAGHLQKHIADKEDAGAKSKHCRPKIKILIHPKSGKADIDSIEVVEEHHYKKERDDPPIDAMDRGCFQIAA